MARTSKTPTKPSKKLSSKLPVTSALKPKTQPAKAIATKTTPSKTNEDFQEVRSLIELLKKNGLAVLEFSKGDFKITLKTPEGTTASPAGAVYHAAPPAPTVATPVASAVGSEGTEPAKSNYKEIKSPMVGTFYTSPSPEAPAFVEPGKEINAESVVCIIEAMKVMNEIKAEMSGKIVEIVAENGKPVQFGEVLFRVS